jgi:uncharacterized membrane protein
MGTMTEKEIQEIWERLKNANTVSNGIDMMLAMDLTLLLKEVERLNKKLEDTVAFYNSKIK